MAKHGILRTPLLPLGNVHLKLENLQPIGSFKIRGAVNAVRNRKPKAVWTASAGNMAQGVAWAARMAGIPATIVLPDGAPEVKREAVRRLGGKIIDVPYERWWQCFVDRAYPGVDGEFIAPFDDDDVMQGNGSIGTEILEDLPDVENILVPWGGGGLACGIAMAVDRKVWAVEVETASPLTASLAAGRPVEIEVTRTFIDGIGGRTCFPRMFELAKTHLAGTLVVKVDRVKEAIRRMAFEAHVIAEGAGAAALAAAAEVRGPTACIVSGGNIDRSVLQEILR